MHTIYKFPLDIYDKQTIMLTNNSRILHVGQQNKQLVMWVELYSEHPFDTPKTIRVCGTGQPMPENCAYLGTVPINEYVWHVFQELGTG